MNKRSRLLTAAFVVAVVVLFLLANRSAYKGFFTDDDFSNLANARFSSLAEYAHAFFKPNSGPGDTFRVAGYSYVFVAIRTAGLRYVPYVASIQAIHLFNVLLVWLLARALGATQVGAAGAALLFVFHAATLDEYWKPMYVFDLLCATFTLACLLAYVRGRILLSLLLFWVAYKCKEVMILLPVVLAGYEFLFSERRWRRVIPFAGISALLGVLALSHNTHSDNDYTLRFTAAAIAKCATFYAQQVMFVPYAGFAVVALPFLIREKKVRLGVIAFLAPLIPMLVLPGRLFEAYLYVPLIGLALALSAVDRPVWLAAFFLLWFPWNYHQLRHYRSDTLATAKERQGWFEPVAAYVREHPEQDSFVYDGSPATLGQPGIEGALALLRYPQVTHVAALAGSAQTDTPRQGDAIIVWSWPVQRSDVRK